MQTCWLGLPVPGSSTLWEGKEEGVRGEGRSYTYIFVLPTDSSCCVLSSVGVTPYMGSGPEHCPPSITTDKLISQLGSGWDPMGAFMALLAHAHGNKHTHIYTHPEMHAHACTHLANASPSLAPVSSSWSCLLTWETDLFALPDEPLSSETMKCQEDPAEILLLQSAHTNVREQAFSLFFK